MNREVRVLFVTWDGPNSSYLRGLFLPIFTSLRKHGYAFHILQFTWAKNAERSELQRVCASAQIPYRSVPVLRSPLAVGSLATAVYGRRAVRAAVRDFRIDLLMPRSTLPALAVILASKLLPIMLDADGLPADERVEFHSASQHGLVYRLLRILESWSVRRSDAVTVRTQRAADILAARAGVLSELFHVVPNGRDAMLFHPMSSGAREELRTKLGIGDAPVLAYAGSSLSGKYLGDAMLRFFRHVRARRPDARFLLLMPIPDEARALLSLHEDLTSACIIRAAAPEDVPDWLGIADLGLCLIRPTYSMQAVSAVKLGEYLLCGIPVLATAGVGNSEEVITSNTGLCLAETTEDNLTRAATWFVESILPHREAFRRRCRQSGLAHFGLDMTVHKYEVALLAAATAVSSRHKLPPR